MRVGGGASRVVTRVGDGPAGAGDIVEWLAAVAVKVRLGDRLNARYYRLSDCIIRITFYFFPHIFIARPMTLCDGSNCSCSSLGSTLNSFTIPLNRASALTVASPSSVIKRL